MRDIANEMMSAVLISRMKDYLMHVGVGHDDDPPGRGSGRYGWGTGENPGQHHSLPSLEYIEELSRSINPKTGKKYTDAEIAEKCNIIGRSGKPSSGTLRAYREILTAERRTKQYQKALELRDKGWSYQKIADELGYNNDSSVRNLLNEDAQARKTQAIKTADYIQSCVDKNGMYDVGKGAEVPLGISKEKLATALEILEMRGYPVYGGGIPQPTNKGQQTNQKVICPPGTEHKEIFDFNNTVHNFLEDNMDTRLTDQGGNIRKKFEYPSSLDSSRVQIVYAEEGGIKKDGLVEIRRGLDDCNLGDNHYAQVRILVDGTHYVKGMAVYSDDLPDGVDVRFNTNKHVGTPMCGEDKNNTVLKKIGKDPENPFGALIKENGGQTYYDDPKGKFVDAETGKRQSLNVVNMKSIEGDWQDWKDTLPHQFLAKQSLQLAKQQMKIAQDDKHDEFKEIMSITNPTLRKNLLIEFGDKCDSAAVELRGAAFPRQKFQVLLPLKSIKDNEIYAPNYRDGEQVALVRFPHQGLFEIPILTVNNKQREGIKQIGKDSKDAVGINLNTADRLSGADFDGDTVMVIPLSDKVKVKNIPMLEELKGFNAKEQYPARPGMQKMTRTDIEMGKITNLMTDATVMNAPPEDLAKITKQCLVVIDAEKHNLDWKRAEVDNDIAALRRKYQLKENGRAGGAATIFSRSKGEVDVDKRQGARHIDPETGKVTWKTADDNKLYYQVWKQNKAYKELTGDPSWNTLTPAEKKAKLDAGLADGSLSKVTKKHTQKEHRMNLTDDAMSLVSVYKDPKEIYYANWANDMKALANQARKEALATPKIEYSKSAASKYKAEVDDLMKQLNECKKQQIRERSALRISNAKIKAAEENLKEMGFTNKELNKEMKKIRQRELTEARVRTGAKRVEIDINDRQWEAIQAGAISDTKLNEIFRHSDGAKLRERATPHSNRELATWKQNKIAAMRTMGYTIEEIARSLGVSSSTVQKYM